MDGFSLVNELLGHLGIGNYLEFGISDLAVSGFFSSLQAWH
jgi:hypothetical protein